MPPIIEKLVLKRFRSFPSDTVHFDSPVFLVGRNGAGKSNFVDVFAFLSEAMSSPLQAVFDKRGGISAVRNRSSSKSKPPNFGLQVKLGALNGVLQGGQYAFEIRALPNYGFEVVREQCKVTDTQGRQYYFDREKQFKTNIAGLTPALDPASLCLPVVGGEERFAPIVRALLKMKVYSIEPARLREMQDPDGGATLRADGGNAASVLQELQRSSQNSFNRICEVLEKIVPSTNSVRSKKHGNKLSLEFTQNWGQKTGLKFEAYNMSDGTLRALGMLTAVFQQPPPSVLVIEEPEQTIHPGALGTILDLIHHASSRMQVIVTTHSPELLDAKWIEDKHLRIATWREGASYILPLSDAGRESLKGHLMGAGELLRTGILESPPLFSEDMAQGQLFEEWT